MCREIQQLVKKAAAPRAIARFGQLQPEMSPHLIITFIARILANGRESQECLAPEQEQSVPPRGSIDRLAAELDTQEIVVLYA